MNTTSRASRSVPPPTGAGTSPLDWSKLKFNPVGLYDLRRLQGFLPSHPSIFEEHRERFLASDIAWFAAGCHRDRSHDLRRENFHPMFHDFMQYGSLLPAKAERKNLTEKLRALTFDLVTLWDRISGGTTFLMHCNGTNIPGSPDSPEYLKAHVYLPPAFLDHHKSLHSYVLDTVQRFLETIGVATVRSWALRARNDLGYSLTQPGNPTPNAVMTAIPTPVSGTSYYVFLGQPSHQHYGPGTPAPSSSFHDAKSAAAHVREQEELTELLLAQNTSYVAHVQQLEEQLALLQVTASTLSTPATAPSEALHRDRFQDAESSIHHFATPSRKPRKADPLSTKARKDLSPSFNTPYDTADAFITKRKKSTLNSASVYLPFSVASTSTVVSTPCSTPQGFNSNQDLQQDGIASGSISTALQVSPILSLFLNTNGLAHLEFLVTLIVKNCSGAREQTVQLRLLDISDSLCKKICHIAAVDFS